MRVKYEMFVTQLLRLCNEQQSLFEYDYAGPGAFKTSSVE